MLKDKIRYIFEEIKLVRKMSDIKILLQKLPFSPQRIFGNKYAKETKVPLSLQIEPTNHCNIKCISCPRDTMGREKGYMDFTLFQKIIDEASKIGVKYIHLYLHGEPFMHPKIVDMMSYIKLRGLNFSITTNGTLLNENINKGILNSGVTIADYVNISILGVSKETHENTMKGINHEKVINNIMNLINLRKKYRMKSPIIQTVFYQMPENSHESKLYIKEWKNKVDHATLVSSISYSYADYGEEQLTEGPLRKNTCTQMWERMTIFWNGDVSLCIQDVNGDYIIGNLNESTIEMLWNSDKLRTIRNLHKEKRFSEIKICERCDI